MILTSCTRTIRSASDELPMFQWEAQYDNGNHASLIIEDDIAEFCVDNDAFALNLSGDYLIDDDSLTIFDNTTQMSYHFGYLIHGDSVELTFGDGTIVLNKI